MGIISLVALSIAFAVVQVMFQPSLRHHEHKITKWLQGPQASLTRAISLLTKVFGKLQKYLKSFISSAGSTSTDPREAYIQEIAALADQHEVAETMRDLIHKDGAGSWPPNANHTHSSWPAALRPYGEIYLELAALLPQEHPSLDDETNIVRIADFRGRFKSLLAERINLAEVNELMEAAAAGRWDVFPREVFNGLYSCLAASRHAYRWATVPVVVVAQLEKEVELPKELVLPWTVIQRHHQCPSESGNNTSNLVMNFDTQGNYIYKINTGMPEAIMSGEEAFARIFYDVEKYGVPVYHGMIHAIDTFAKGDKAACARHVATVAAEMRLVLGTYFDRLHNKMIARSVWLSHVQGYYAWGAGNFNKETGEWENYDGLSGNQILLFQALDAFLGMDQYLAPRDRERNVPKRQRDLCDLMKKHCFRSMLSETSEDPHEIEIVCNMNDILKRLRMFRAAHRTRAKGYLAQEAPERLQMTAGKSLLGATFESSFAFLDEFMIRRMGQTV